MSTFIQRTLLGLSLSILPYSSLLAGGFSEIESEKIKTHVLRRKTGSYEIHEHYSSDSLKTSILSKYKQTYYTTHRNGKEEQVKIHGRNRAALEDAQDLYKRQQKKKAEGKHKRKPAGLIKKSA